MCNSNQYITITQSLFVGLLTVTDTHLELAGGEGEGAFVLLALVALHPFVMYNSRPPTLPSPIKLYTFLYRKFIHPTRGINDFMLLVSLPASS